MSEPFDTLSQGLRGSYILERPIGEGGMATVYLAQDLKHQRPVALKVLKPELSHDIGPDRFRREITTAARLQHPHILSVHDSGETQGQFWFTMPYVEGESLRDRLKREGSLPIEDALRITREAAQALQYAHERGIVHRDIKPENLMLTRDGFTLVADFGIARALGTGMDSTTEEHLTQTGASIGTPTYMAPEQATGDKNIDARVDQYSLAATLYEMLAGDPPFTGSTAAALIAKRFSSPAPSVRAKRREVPPMVDQALQQALSLRATDRFASIQEFARAVTATLATPSSASTAALPTVPTPGSGAVPAIPRPRRFPTVLVGVAVLALLGAGALVMRRGGAAAAGSTSSAPPAAAGPTRLVVLPFENLGDTADAYFADGIADELRGKLTGVPGLEVIARASSVQYRGTTKPQQEIAKELGVRYLLTGTVRWEKSGGGKGRVRVSPELIEVSPSGAPASKWQQAFDAPLTDVFQVQSGIAEKVASALNVALGAGDQQKLAEQPTQDLAAYQAFLQGEAASQGMSESGAVELRSAYHYFEQAVTLDSGFVLAWSRLAQARSRAYFAGQPTPENKAKAQAAAQRALALAPNQAAAHLAMGEFYYYVLADPARAKSELDEALALDPRSADVLTALAQVEQSLGNWESALAHLQQAQAMDPRSRNTARRVAQALLWTRRHDEALAAADRAWSFNPASAQLVELKAMIRLGQGDLAGARAIAKAASRDIPPAQLLTYFANYWDLYWVLDDAQQLALLQLGPDAFDDNRAPWALVQAETRALRGDAAGARAFADTAQAEFGAQARAAPTDAQSHMLRALALAYLGRNTEAVAAADAGIVLEQQDVGYSLPYYRFILIRVLILTGVHDRAVAELEQLLAKPYYVSKAWLKVDPTFDPLRNNPGFQKLVAGR